jgi:hypothetical protein
LLVLADERESEWKEWSKRKWHNNGRNLAETENNGFVNMSKPSTFVDRSFLFCESAELSLLSKDENNKTNDQNASGKRFPNCWLWVTNQCLFHCKILVLIQELSDR